MITPDTYPQALSLLVTLAGSFLAIADQVDVQEMRLICERFQAAAPVIAPTAYRGMENLRDQDAFLKAVDDFVMALRALEPQEARKE